MRTRNRTRKAYGKPGSGLFRSVNEVNQAGSYAVDESEINPIPDREDKKHMSLYLTPETRRRLSSYIAERHDGKQRQASKLIGKIVERFLTAEGF